MPFPRLTGMLKGGTLARLLSTPSWRHTTSRERLWFLSPHLAAAASRPDGAVRAIRTCSKMAESWRTKTKSKPAKIWKPLIQMSIGRKADSWIEHQRKTWRIGLRIYKLSMNLYYGQCHNEAQPIIVVIFFSLPSKKERWRCGLNWIWCSLVYPHIIYP